MERKKNHVKSFAYKPNCDRTQWACYWLIQCKDFILNEANRETENIYSILCSLFRTAGTDGMKSIRILCLTWEFIQNIHIIFWLMDRSINQTFSSLILNKQTKKKKCNERRKSGFHKCFSARQMLLMLLTNYIKTFWNEKRISDG